MKILYTDTETTGLDPKKHDIIQIAGIVEIDDIIKEEFNFTCQPFSYENIDQEALKVNGISVETLKTYPAPKETYRKLITIFNKYIDRYNKKDKFIPAGHNVSFDVDFLFNFFKKNGDNYCGSYLDYHKLDSVTMGMILKIYGKEKFDNLKLKTIADYYKLEIAAHDALSDIRASREVIKKFKDYLK